ncbi:ArsR/SmtB family transcription factor [Sediminivirga luteola]|uniref:Transcriptional regulator n=1 Tax=Sediminivirga luteola TaxID=1774748 RepID=A0A8J2U1C0_9MICO|nr:helix-turn-helix domain-containing protein [Sediminivirga luteola]GGA27800.1 transcriptional regulator [Sediminivirga luteola]
MTDEDATRLAEELEGLRARVEALEARAARGVAGAIGPEQPADEDAAPEDDVFWALNGLRARLDEAGPEAGAEAGAVMLLGSVTLPAGPVEWQYGTPAGPLLQEDWSDRVTALAALSHPVRLELLRQVLHGVETTAALTELEGLGTTGQLHHHLRQLIAGGWLRQRGRGRYEVPPERVVPLLVCLMGVRPV